MSVVRVTLPAPRASRLIVAARTVPESWRPSPTTSAFADWCEAAAPGWEFVMMGHLEWSRWRPGAELCHGYVVDKWE